MASDVMTPGFWEIGNYKHNVKRIKDGIDQLDDFSKMNRERAEIEAKYSKMLAQFADKWKSHVDRVVPAGCVKTVWNELVSEAAMMAKVHNNLKDRLMEDIVKETLNYRKNSIHHSLLKGPKEIREIEDGFEKAQKPWKKRYDRMEEKRQKYYSSCRQEKSAFVNLQNCQGDSSISPDTAAKFRDRHEKLKEDVQKAKIEYEGTLVVLNEYKSVYEEAMSYVFKKCQEKELERAKFLIEVVEKTQQLQVDLLRNNQIIGLHQQLEQTIKSADATAVQRDLSEWSRTNGVDAPCAWPTFIEYSPEMRNISTKSSNAGSGGEKAAGGVILTRQITKFDDVPITGITSIAQTQTREDSYETGKTSPKSCSDSDTNTFDSRKMDRIKNASRQSQAAKSWTNSGETPPSSAGTPDSAKYGDFEDQTAKPAVVLYDYNPTDNDEIRLRKGDNIEVLGEPDSLGWCTGRINGVVGLFPATYVQYT